MVTSKFMLSIILYLFMYTVLPLVFKKKYAEFVQNSLRAMLYTFVFIINIFPPISSLDYFNNTLEISVVAIAGINMIVYIKAAIAKYREFLYQESQAITPEQKYGRLYKSITKISKK